MGGFEIHKTDLFSFMAKCTKGNVVLRSHWMGRELSLVTWFKSAGGWRGKLSGRSVVFGLLEGSVFL